MFITIPVRSSIGPLTVTSTGKDQSSIRSFSTHYISHEPSQKQKAHHNITMRISFFGQTGFFTQALHILKQNVAAYVSLTHVIVSMAVGIITFGEDLKVLCIGQMLAVCSNKK
jgi:hypothetical protein